MITFLTLRASLETEGASQMYSPPGKTITKMEENKNIPSTGLCLSILAT